MKPFAGTSTSEFAFKPEGNQTAVTWSTSGHDNFIAKAMCLFVNMDKMLGGDMEKGLAQMKSAVARGRPLGNRPGRRPTLPAGFGRETERT